MLLFDLPMRGSWLRAPRRRVAVPGRRAWHLACSSRRIADSQQVAFQLALLTSFLPTLMLSGFIFPISSMPAFLQVVTYVVPARYFLVALRGDRAQGRRASSDFWPARWLALVASTPSRCLDLASVRLVERGKWA